MQQYKRALLLVCFSGFLHMTRPLLSGYHKPLSSSAANLAQQLNETTEDEKGTVLTFFGAFPTNSKVFYRLELVRPALDYALELIKNTTFPDEKFEFQYIGTNELDGCNGVDNMIVYKTIDHVTQMRVLSSVLPGAYMLPVGYFGPGCAKGVRDMAQWLNVVNHILFDAQAASVELSDKSAYRTLIRTGYTDGRLLEFYENILDHFGWTNVTIFYQGDDPVWTSIYASVSDITPHRISFCEGNSLQNRNLHSLLSEIEYNSTAILIFANMSCVQDLLVEAVNMNLTEGNKMSFVINRFFKARYWGSLALDSSDGEADDFGLTDEYKEKLLQAYNRTLLVSYYYNDTIRAGMQELNRTLMNYVVTKYPNYTQFEEAIRNEGINPVVLGYYFGVFLYAQAVQSIFASNARVYQNMDERLRLYEDGQRIAAEIKRIRTFDIPHIGQITLNEDGDFVGQFSLNIYDTKSKAFETWVTFEPQDPKPEVVCSEYQFDAAMCPLRRPTINTPALDDTYPSPASQVSILIGAAAVVVCVITGSGIVIRYYVNKTFLANRWWDIKPTELIFQSEDSRRYLHNEDSQRSDYDNAAVHDTTTLATCGTFKSVFSSHAHDDGINLAKYKNRLVSIRIVKKKLAVHKQELFQLRDTRVHHHENLLRLYGLVIQQSQFIIVQEHSARGTLTEFLLREDTSIQSSDWPFRHSLLHDLLEAMSYIHRMFGYHGRLSSFNCTIDRSFILKVRDFAPRFLQTPLEEMEPEDLLWTAPEILRRQRLIKTEFQKADVYSIGIIFQEIATECHPFPNVEKTDFILPLPEIIDRVRSMEEPPFRPLVPLDSTCNNSSSFHAMMEACWNERPAARPSLTQLRATLRRIRGNVKGTLIDDLYQRVQSHADQLQKTVEERTQQLREEQSKIQGLLYELLPPSVADRLITTRKVDPEPFECVTIYFSDIVSFTTIAAESTPDEVVHMLNLLYQLFDSIIEYYDAYKVETIGDAYMVVSGLPKRNGEEHASICSLMALNILHAAREFEIPHRRSEKLKIRIGMHSGPCVAGVVGTKMPRYCLFGDTVNTASRMESTSEANRIQLSSATYELIKSKNNFKVTSRGVVNIKGKGEMETYWLLGGPVNHAFPRRSNTISSSYFVDTMRGTLRRSRRPDLEKRMSMISFSDL